MAKVYASALAFVVYSRALRELDASLVGAYLNLDPIVGVLTALILLGETLGVWQVRNLEEAQPLLGRLLAELSEDDRASAWAEIRRTLQPFVGLDGFAAPSEALIAAGVA